MDISSGISNLSSIPTRSHSVLQNLFNNDHPFYSAEAKRIAANTILTGLDAAKTATPSVGQIYFATDTTRLYICFATNVWTQVDDICVPSSPSQGDIIYYDGVKWNRLAAGTSGQFLKTLGAGANPLWSTASGNVFADGAGGSIASSNTGEVTIESFTLNGNSLGTAGALKMKVYWNAFNIMNGGNNCTLRCYYGATSISGTTTKAVGASTNAPAVTEFEIVAAGSTGSQVLSAQHRVFSNGVASITTDLNLGFNGTASIDSTANQTVKITSQDGGNTGTTQTWVTSYAFL